MFSSASTIEKRGSAPKNSAASPWARCRSTKSVCDGATFASAVATLTASGRRADAALGADEREHFAGWPPARRDARRGARSPARAPPRVIGSCEELGGAGPHRLEQDRRVRLGGHDQEPDAGCCRFTAAIDGGMARAPRVSTTMTCGCWAAGCASAVRSAALAARRAHAARAQELLELAIERIDDEHFGNQMCSHVCIAHRTSSTCRRNEAVSSTLPPPFVSPGNRDQAADDVLVARPAHAFDEEAHDVRDRSRSSCRWASPAKNASMSNSGTGTMRGLLA